jgi:integrase
VLTANPLIEHRRERPTRAQKLEREEPGRALTSDEIKAVWKASETPTAYHRLVRFVLLSGCRRTEASMVARNMVAEEPEGARVLVIPKGATKSGRDHRLPLTPQISDLLEACPIDARSDLFFASPKTGREVKGWSKLHAAFVERAGVSFGLHDLRRTMKTRMDEMGVDSDISEVCLNHTRQGLEGIYNKNTASAEVRAAFTLWGNFVCPRPSEVPCERLGQQQDGGQ